MAGTLHALVAAGRHAKVMVPLNRSACRLLRAHRALTLSVTAVVTHLPDAPTRETFVFSVKAPAHAKH
jgi:hypothetical protein